MHDTGKTIVEIDRRDAQFGTVAQTTWSRVVDDIPFDFGPVTLKFLFPVVSTAVFYSKVLVPKFLSR